MSSIRIPFLQRLQTLLIQARDHPETANEIGIFWISSTEFIANSKILAIKMGLRKNTICYDWRSHGFISSSARNKRNFIAHLPDPSGWKLHSRSNLTRESIENAFSGIDWKQPTPIPGRRQTHKKQNHVQVTATIIPPVPEQLPPFLEEPSDILTELYQKESILEFKSFETEYFTKSFQEELMLGFRSFEMENDQIQIFS
jgi:hypothetical protein